jgi:hypothetical protein
VKRVNVNLNGKEGARSQSRDLYGNGVCEFYDTLKGSALKGMGVHIDNETPLVDLTDDTWRIQLRP